MPVVEGSGERVWKSYLLCGLPPFRLSPSRLLLPEGCRRLSEGLGRAVERHDGTGFTQQSLRGVITAFVIRVKYKVGRLVFLQVLTLLPCPGAGARPRVLAQETTAAETVPGGHFGAGFVPAAPSDLLPQDADARRPLL